ncbi:hypothetical protein [Maricaulis sp. W15]|uniref:hypothetical protein n=1 Tax=Maricaulis sp. W15 TaxID=1772333 RepID=UPI000A7171D1|nr:hypothetical protein [Maricaulis sp. W15]
MNNNYSMRGFELKLVNNVIELRAEGERVAGAERAPASAFTSIAAKIDSHLILYDIRSADYKLGELDWEERFRFVARLFKGYRIAYVVRKEQRDIARGACRAHARNGDKADVFTSKTRALDWLKN